MSYNRARVSRDGARTHPMAKKRTYRVVFHNQGKIYELYARSVSHSEMYGFVEIGELIFGERTAILVDPSEEKLKGEFAGVERTFVPIHSVIRIDQVEKSGANKVLPMGESASNIARFPMPYAPPGGDPGSGKKP